MFLLVFFFDEAEDYSAVREVCTRCPTVGEGGREGAGGGLFYFGSCVTGTSGGLCVFMLA